MKILVTGSGGMLASALAELLEREHRVSALSRKEFDITDVSSVRKNILRVSPQVIVNCAAYTKVDKAEEERSEAFLINAEGPRNLAAVCRKLGARLIHISTDFVFDGKKSVPYKEEARPYPLSVYGMSKLQGEKNVQDETTDFIIIRTSWLYGRGKDNFVKKVASLARKRKDLPVVYDQIGTPTYTGDLSTAIMNLLDKPPGIYHFSNEGVASWYDFAHAIVEEMKKGGMKMRLEALRPILTEEYPAPAKRPAYSVLDKSKYKRITGEAIPHWRESLSRYVAEELWRRR
ncbi:MAG: dTDP-4-dehydrorhamnose reductase [Deltaproteobacteria bacterium]|nr:dTDP-4-dehydrorhamnose reductase [Deltaproteobacteria bacterium]